MADLGSGVMDDAMVESAAYVLSSRAVTSAIPFFRMLGIEDRAASLLREVVAISAQERPERTFLHALSFFTAIPEAPFAYWTTSELTSSLAKFDSFEPTIAEIRVGLTTLDNPRFVRALWEVPPSALGVSGDFSQKAQTKWAPLVIGGKSQPWFSPIQVCVLWGENGRELREYIRTRGSESRWIRSPEFYFRPGFSWTRRAVRFIPYAIPRGCIPTASRYMAYPRAGYEVSAIGVSASNIATVFLRFYGEMFERPNYLVDTVKALPWPKLNPSVEDRLKAIVEREVEQRRSAYRNHEPFQDFVLPSSIKAYSSGVDCDLSSFLGSDLELEVAAGYGLTTKGYQTAIEDLKEALVANNHIAPNKTDDDGEDDEDTDSGLDDLLTETERTRQEALLSYCVGVICGRWDVRMALDTSLVPKMSTTFDSLPVCPPGTLVGTDGLPAASGSIVSREWLLARAEMGHLPTGVNAKSVIEDGEYPVRISWDGILADDPGHHDDIVRRVREVLESLWIDQAEEIERRVCNGLGIEELVVYFRRPSKDGFFDDHISRYSKGRRKAPIYWLLQSSKRNYGLWVYYSRFDKDVLFKALVNFVEPKIRLEQDRLDGLRRSAVGESGKNSRRYAKEMERLDEFISELRDFEDKLRRAANLHLEPDLNDGVVLNIAPLHELVPWKEARKYWADLLKGEYEWSSIGKQLRLKGLVK